MTSLGEDDKGRFVVAREAVRIVRRFNTAKDKDERQRKIFELCTDIAGILDAKRRLEDLVKKQNAELHELRQRISSANTALTSGRGSLIPDSTDEFNPQVSSTLFSGRRGTALCHRGTDPLFEWPERPSTCTRSTSPLSFPVWSITSPVDSPEPLTIQELVEDIDDTLKDEAEKPGKKDEYHLGDDNTDVDESQRRNKESDDQLKENEVEATKQVEDKDDDRKIVKSASKQRPTSTKTTLQTSKQTSKGVVTSSKKPEKIRVRSARDNSARKSAGQRKRL